MQATVSSYDIASRSGSLVDDTGAPWEFAADAVADHVRHLRPGQRVHVVVTDDVVSSVRIWP